MEWRKIPVCPESKTGQIRFVKRMPVLGITTSVRIVPAYTYEDVWDFYHKKKFDALHQNPRNNFLESFREFEHKNSEFVNALERVHWPIEDVAILGPMYIPISDEQLQFEQIEPFLKLGHFSTLPFELQLLVLRFVESEERDKLLTEVSSERQAELLYAILDPTN